jgi:hypothetical protein
MKFSHRKAWATSPIGRAAITGLSANTKFYVRAIYTITESKITGTFSCNEMMATTLPPPATKQYGFLLARQIHQRTKTNHRTHLLLHRHIQTLWQIMLVALPFTYATPQIHA